MMKIYVVACLCAIALITTASANNLVFTNVSLEYVTNADPDGDIDGDGMTEIKEWISDTVPMNSDSYFRSTDLDETNAFNITFTTSTNRIYDL